MFSNTNITYNRIVITNSSFLIEHLKSEHVNNTDFVLLFTYLYYMTLTHNIYVYIYLYLIIIFPILIDTFFIKELCCGMTRKYW